MSNTGSGDNQVKILLEKCEKLPKWAKDRILVCYDEGSNWNGVMYLDGFCQNEKINDDMVPELLQCIEIFENKINELNLQINKLTSKGAVVLFEALKLRTSSINTIHMSLNQLNDECMKSLGEFIENSKIIKNINVGNNKLTDKGIRILSKHLIGNKVLNTLDVSWNEGITDKSIPILMKMIESSHIADVYIQNTSIAQQNVLFVSIIDNILKYGHGFINFGSRSLTDDDMIKMSELIKKYGCDKLKVIDFQFNKITSKGAVILFEALRRVNLSVTTFILYSNEIDDGCMKSLGEIIENNETMKCINISKNNISDQGIEELSDYLIGNTTLESLDVSRNEGIKDKSFPYLVDIAMKSGIIEIGLDGTSISEENKNEISKLIEIPANKREIPIKSAAKSAAKIA